MRIEASIRDLNINKVDLKKKFLLIEGKYIVDFLRSSSLYVIDPSYCLFYVSTISFYGIDSHLSYYLSTEGHILRLLRNFT